MNQNHSGDGDNVAGDKILNVDISHLISVPKLVSDFFSTYFLILIRPKFFFNTTRYLYKSEDERRIESAAITYIFLALFFGLLIGNTLRIENGNLLIGLDAIIATVFPYCLISVFYAFLIHVLFLLFGAKGTLANTITSLLYSFGTVHLTFVVIISITSWFEPGMISYREYTKLSWMAGFVAVNRAPLDAVLMLMNYGVVVFYLPFIARYVHRLTWLRTLIIVGIVIVVIMWRLNRYFFH